MVLEKDEAGNIKILNTGIYIYLFLNNNCFLNIETFSTGTASKCSYVETFSFTKNPVFYFVIPQVMVS